MSLPAVSAVLRNLRNDGDHKLADRIENEVSRWRCKTCGWVSNPGFEFSDPPPTTEDDPVAVFHCPFCSSEKVRVDNGPEDPS
jgi:rubredoxin